MKDAKSAGEDGGGESSYELRQRTFAALGATSVIVAADKLVQIVMLAVLARLISPEETSVAAAAGLIASIFSLLNSFGIPAGLTQARTVSASDKASARGLFLATGLAYVCLIEIFAPLAGEWFRNADVTAGVRIICVLILFQPLALMATVSLLRKLKARDVALAELFSGSAGLLIVTMPMALAGQGWRALVFGVLAQVGLRTILLCWFARESITVRLSARSSLGFYRLGSGFLVNNLLNKAGTDTPRWIIGRFLPGRDLGLFTHAHSLMGFPAGFFGAAIDRVVFAAVAIVQDETERLRAAVVDGVRLTALIGMPLTVAMVLLGEEIILTFLGPTWAGAVEPFMILSVATYFRLADKLNWVVLRGIGKPYRLAFMQALYLAAIFGGCVWGAMHSLAHVATAVAVVTLAGYLLNTVAAMHAVGISFFTWIKAQGHGLVCALLALVILAPVERVAQIASLPPLLIICACAAAGGLAGALAVWIAPRLFIGQTAQRLLQMVLDRVLERLTPRSRTRRVGTRP